jgi:hypothetical protein
MAETRGKLSYLWSFAPMSVSCNLPGTRWHGTASEWEALGQTGV